MTTGRFCAIVMLALFSDFARAQSTRPAEQDNAGGDATAGHVATSQPAPPPFFRLDYSGDFWTSPGLTGDWGGARTKLANKGISFNVEMLNYVQGNAHGGKSTNDAFRYGGSTDYFLQLDTGRMGLWPGGYFKVRGETRWGEGVTKQVGAIAPPNFDALLPLPEPGGITTLTEYYMMQFLSEKFAVIAGQVDLTRLPGGINAFFSDPYNQFMNTALWYPATLTSTLPYAAMTAGAIYMPTDWFTGATAVVDSHGWPTYSGFETAFHGEQGVTMLQSLTFNVKPFGQEGHQRLLFSLSTRERVPLDEIGRLALAGVPLPRDPRLDFPGPLSVGGRKWQLPKSPFRALLSRTLEPETVGDNWAFMYNFDQYLYTKPGDPTQGFGLFGMFAWAPGTVNPITESYSFGVGGKGLVPTRAHDRYGIGYYYLNLSDDLPSLFSAYAEQGVEVFYNFEITPWLHVTPDLQVIVDPGGSSKKDTAIVYGLRAQITF
jgi:porin